MPCAHEREIFFEPNRTTALGNQVRARQRRHIPLLKENKFGQMWLHETVPMAFGLALAYRVSRFVESEA